MKRAKKHNWSALIEEQRKSGKSVKAFCEEKGVHFSGFYRFIGKQLSRELVEVPVKEIGSSRCEIITINYRDYTISVPREITQHHLVEVLKVVKEVSCS